MTEKRKIIIVTDGDKVARKAVEIAAKNIGGRCISRSAGNPTELDGDEIAQLVSSAKYDPVVVMFDDRGHPGFGEGEQALLKVVNSDNVEVIGVVAVASNTEGVQGVDIDFSINCDCQKVNIGVDKYGSETKDNKVYGDTVDVLNSFSVPVTIGVGDIGKMNGKDDYIIGAPVLTRAFEEIIKRYDSKNV